MTAQQIAPRRGPKPAEETLPERVEGCLYGVTLELLGARQALDDDEFATAGGLA